MRGIKVKFWTFMVDLIHLMWDYSEAVLIVHETRLCKNCKNKVCQDQYDDRECWID